MKNTPSGIAVLILSFVAVLSIGGTAALQTWFVCFFCLATLVSLAVADARNLVSLRVSRWFPVAILFVYVVGVAICASLLEAYFSAYVAIYAALVCIAIADHAGQLLVGTHIVMLIGKDHLGRRGPSQQETQYHY